MRVLIAAALFVAPVWTHAAEVERPGITVSPITISLSAKRPADAVTFSNGTAESKVIQVEIMRWSRVNGEDRFEVAPEMIVSPPMFRVAAGAKQVVRVGLKSRADARSSIEKTYRMFLQEVPETLPVPALEGGGSALRLLLRFGVPVFIRPEKPSPESLAWKAQLTKDGSIALSLDNRGNQHLRVSEVRLQSDGKSVNAGNFAYVFSGETYTWTLRPGFPIKTGAATVSARTDEGLVHAGLTIQGL